MFIGNPEKTDPTVSTFRDKVEKGFLYIDKSAFIEHYLLQSMSVEIIDRPRHFGKTLNLDMLYTFLNDREDCTDLFKGLYIQESGVWEKRNSAPCFLYDFSRLCKNTYRDCVFDITKEYIRSYAGQLDPDSGLYDSYYRWESSPGLWDSSLLLLTQIVYAVTGRRSYVFIDNHDTLLMDLIGKPEYPEAESFLSQVYSNVFKGNECLEKGLLTGVYRVSHRGMMTAFNNPVTRDVFSDGVYGEDYGFTLSEMEDLHEPCGFDMNGMRRRYCCAKIAGTEIFNPYGVLNGIRDKGKPYKPHMKFDCLETILELLNEERKRTLMSLLEPGTAATVRIGSCISPKQLAGERCTDRTFYSFLVQSGYVTLKTYNDDESAVISIPNEELRAAWKDALGEESFLHI